MWPFKYGIGARNPCTDIKKEGEMNNNYPSVTTILSPYVDFSMVPEHVLSRATERGSKVHAICAAILQGLWVPEIDPECAGYIASFQAWKEQFVEEVIFVEKELTDPTYGFMGHLDFFGRLKRLGYALLDWKTPITLYKAWRLQMAGYNRLLEVEREQVDVVASLQLDPNGGIPKMVRYENSAQDFNIFLGLLNGHNYFK